MLHHDRAATLQGTALYKWPYEKSPERKGFIWQLSARRQMFNHGSLSKHYRTPAMLYRTKQVPQAQWQLQARGSGQFQPQAHLFQSRSRGLAEGSNPALYTWARGNGKAASWAWLHAAA
jgi:hypothetical protein